MSDLHLTKTRAALLRAVYAGDVVDGPDDQGNVHTWLIDPPHQPRKVNARIAEAKAAGWVLRDDRHAWYLTSAGSAALDANGGWGWSEASS